MRSKINEYRIMWVMVLFDLPTETKKERKEHANFRKKLVKDGFTMFQFSVYIRHCPSYENATVHKKRVIGTLPERGNVCIFFITDKQFGEMELYQRRKLVAQIHTGIQQLEFF